MFIIPQRQVAQLDNLYLDRFIREIKAHVQVFFPEEYAYLAADEHNRVLHEGVRRAKAYGLSTDRNITIFVDFMMTFGTDFPERHDWGKRILNDLTASEDQKIESLLAAIDD